MFMIVAVVMAMEVWLVISVLGYVDILTRLLDIKRKLHAICLELQSIRSPWS